MGVLGVGSAGFHAGATCAALWFGCLLSAACGQTADTPKANSSANGGSTGSATTGGSADNATGTGGSADNATSSGGQSESTGGSIASGGSSDVVPVSSGGVTSTGGAPHMAKACDNPTPQPLGGGVLRCLDGSYRRPQAGSCKTELPRAEPGSTCFAADECCVDADCADAPFGYCTYGNCAYGCVTDSDCANDWLCDCGKPVGVCTPTMCHSDADCPPDRPCSSAGGHGFACQPPTDACVSNFDCAAGYCNGGVCYPPPG